jgi:hypothetical protein
MKSHRIVATVLVVAGTLLTTLSVFTLWVSRQALETDQWSTTSGKLLEQPAIRTAVAGYLTDQLYANVDVAAELRQALPPRAQVLAAPAAGALRSAAGDVARRALETPAAQQAWRAANRSAHATFVKVVEGGGDVVSSNGGVVTLDLKALLRQLEVRTGIGGRAAKLLPADAATIRILRSDQLETIQKVGKALKPLAALFIILSLACFGGAIVLSPGRRREALRAAGIGFIVAGIGALVLRKLVGGHVVDQLVTTEAIRPAAEDAWHVGTSLLADVAAATIIYGAVVVVGTLYAGGSRPAVAVRRRVSPYLRDARVAYGTLAAVVLLLLLWGPTEGLRRVLPALVLIALMAAGLEALRRQAVREVTAGEAAPADAAALVTLERLDDLHRHGTLDDAEYAAARERVLAHAGGD